MALLRTAWRLDRRLFTLFGSANLYLPSRSNKTTIYFPTLITNSSYLSNYYQTSLYSPARILPNLVASKDFHTGPTTAIDNNNNKMAEQVNNDNIYTEVRLPAFPKPSHYELSLETDLKNFVFNGQVDIDFEQTKSLSTNSVTLNARELEISKGQLVGPNGSAQLVKVTYSKEREVALLEFSNTVQDPTKVSLSYTGILNDQMKGFYRTTFKVGDTTVNAATTQFEATDARRCLPCWDEPAVKATFSVTMTYDNTPLTVDGKSYPIVAISNQPIVKEEQLGSKTKATFLVTPKMSTYLLAFVVGPFEAIEKSDGKRMHRVFTSPGKKDQGLFALDVSCKSLRFYEDYFKIDYPLAKLDLVAVPDFVSGAMENWGLVTYRESCLLHDPAKTSTATKQWIALVVAHELAHQWFGNLVTMEWWTHLWLNEGFATFMEFVCIDHIFPEYKIWERFVTGSYSSALALDALHNSHPIEVPVNHPSEIDEIFDTISYEKGSSVIRMLHTYLGDENFRKGMNQYLLKHAYGNAFTEDLWDSLEKASGKPVTKLMSCWTSQKGYPWLSVDYSNEAGHAKLSLKQSQFTADGKLQEDEKSATWIVPISVGTSKDLDGKSTKSQLLEGATGVITVEGHCESWLKLNPGSIGLYRVAYPDSLTEHLLAAICDRSLPPMDRLGILSDSAALCSAGKLPTTRLLKLLEAYEHEDNYNVWAAIDRSIGRLSLILAGTDYLPKFKAYGRKLYSEVFKTLTWTPKKGESDADALLRSLIINRLILLEEDGIVREAIRRYKEDKHIIPDLRGPIYKAVAKFGEETLFNSIFDKYEQEELSEEKNRLVGALGFANAGHIPKVVEFIMSDKVRNQDKVLALMSIGSNHPLDCWNILKDNEALFKKMYGHSHLMQRLVEVATAYFVDQTISNEIIEYFEAHKFPGTERTVKQSLETIAINSEWLKRDGESIRQYLSNY